METELHTQIFFGNNGNTMALNCPDEDSEMCISVKSVGRTTNYSMTIWEAEQLRDFLIAHINNYHECEKSIV